MDLTYGKLQIYVDVQEGLFDGFAILDSVKAFSGHDGLFTLNISEKNVFTKAGNPDYAKKVSFLKKGILHMYFDVVHGWKDEGRRLTLYDEELSADPVVELTDSEIAGVYGSGSGGIGASSSFSSTSHLHSFALLCDLNTFSLNLIIKGGGIAGTQQACANLL